METNPLTFDAAQQNCQQKGGNLVSIHSNYEQAFLTSVVKDNTVWIGMKLDPVGFVAAARLLLISRRYLAIVTLL